MIHRACRFAASDDAATSVEYAVMLALILMVCFAAIGVFGTQSNQLMNSNNDSLSTVGFGS